MDIFTLYGLRSISLTLMSSLVTLSQSRMIFLPPATGDSSSERSMIWSSFLALASNTGTEQTGGNITVYLPGDAGFSRNAWKRMF